MWRPAPVSLSVAQLVSPSVVVDSSFTPLIAGASYTTLVFGITFLPLFDIYVAMDQVGSLQLQCAFAYTGAGSTFRNVDNPFATPALGTIAYRLVGYRAPNLLARWVLTNPGVVAAAITEFVVINRSI